MFFHLIYRKLNPLTVFGNFFLFNCLYIIRIFDILGAIILFEGIFGCDIDRMFSLNNKLCKLFSSGLLIVPVWSISHTLHFGHVKMYWHCLYCNLFNADTHGRLISIFCCFFAYFCWALNCVSQVWKFHNLFLLCQKTEAIPIFEDF